MKKINRQYQEFNDTLNFIRGVFGDHQYLRKWSGTKFESKINRAVFDIMMFYFSDEKIRAAAQGMNTEIVNAFINLASDSSFISSLETTTKSLEANRTRFARWAEALNNILFTVLESPIR